MKIIEKVDRIYYRNNLQDALTMTALSIVVDGDIDRMRALRVVLETAIPLLDEQLETTDYLYSYPKIRALKKIYGLLIQEIDRKLPGGAK